MKKKRFFFLAKTIMDALKDRPRTPMEHYKHAMTAQAPLLAPPCAYPYSNANSSIAGQLPCLVHPVWPAAEENTCVDGVVDKYS